MTGCNNLKDEVELFVREFDTSYLQKKAGMTVGERVGYMTAMSYYSEEMICPLHDQADVLIAIRGAVEKGRRS